MGLPSPARDPTTSRFPGVWPAQFLHLSEGQLLLDVANTCFLSALHVEEASGPIGHLALLWGAYEHRQGGSLHGIEECGVRVMGA